MPKNDYARLHILIPKAWQKAIRQKAVDENTSAAEVVRQAIAEKYQLPYEPINNPTTT